MMMQVAKHSAADYAAATAALLPPGAAWQWPAGGAGDALLQATAQELARLDQSIQPVLDRAVAVHQPAVHSWHISAYRAVAAAAVAGIAETLPRKPLAAGFLVGDRCWDHDAPGQDFPVDLVQVDHLLTQPLAAGFRSGDRCWDSRGRYVLRVRYYRSVVDPKPLFDVLATFKQSHVYLWFEDITGSAGEVNYETN